MCWITKNKPIKQVAEEDIPVFKIMKKYSSYFLDDNQPLLKLLDKHLISLYQDYVYKEGETYSSEIGKIEKCPNRYSEISEGLHSYSTDCTIQIKHTQSLVLFAKIAQIIYDKYILDVIPAYAISDLLVKVDCVIPKGSEYYLNEHGEYVSNQIKIVKCDKVICVG